MFKPTYIPSVDHCIPLFEAEWTNQEKLKKKKKSKIMVLGEVFNIPGVAGAALQTL